MEDTLTPATIDDAMLGFTAVLELSHPRAWIRYSPHRATPTNAPLIVDGRYFEREVPLSDESVGGFGEQMQEIFMGIPNDLPARVKDPSFASMFALQYGEAIDDQLRAAGWAPLGDWKKADYTLVSFGGDYADPDSSIELPVWESTVYLTWDAFRSAAFDVVGVLQQMADGYHVDCPEPPSVLCEAAQRGFIDDADADWLWLDGFDGYLDLVRRYWAGDHVSPPADADGYELAGTLAETFTDVDDAVSSRLQDMLAELATLGFAVTGIVNEPEALGIVGWVRPGHARNLRDLDLRGGVDYAEVRPAGDVDAWQWEDRLMRPEWVPAPATAIELRSIELAEYGIAAVRAHRGADRFRVLAQNTGGGVELLEGVISATLADARRPRRRRRRAIR